LKPFEGNNHVTFTNRVSAVSEALIPKSERSGLLTRIATERFVMRSDELLTAFLELEAATPSESCTTYISENRRCVPFFLRHKLTRVGSVTG
jgi:hypothetical protein